MASAARGPTLLAFDFDWSLLEENSDTFVIRELGADALFEASKGMPWTQRMDWVLKEAASQLRRTPADVTAALRRAPLHPSLAGLLRAAASEGSSVSGGIDVIILSDANTVYIDTILEHHGLQQHVLAVHTNPAEWRDGALRVGPYHTQPHGCRHCPSNLCKGQVLTEFLSRQAAAGRAYSRVLYVGDGRGDYCPSALLLHGSSSSNGGSSSTQSAVPPPCGASDNVVFAREEYPDGLPCSLWVMLQQAHSVHSVHGGDDAGSRSAGTAAASVSGTAGTPAGAAASRGVVGWTAPEQLAHLIRAELQLEE
ncbi:hypothetical protein ABPG75_010721 [Micractinium tetrahymenae]